MTSDGWIDVSSRFVCLSVRLLPTHLSITANYDFTDSPVIICFVDIDKCAPKKKKKSKSYLVCAGATVPPITVVIHRPSRLDGSGDFVFLCVLLSVLMMESRCRSVRVQKNQTWTCSLSLTPELIFMRKSMKLSENVPHDLLKCKVTLKADIYF